MKAGHIDMQANCTHLLLNVHDLERLATDVQWPTLRIPSINLDIWVKLPPMWLRGYAATTRHAIELCVSH